VQRNGSKLFYIAVKVEAREFTQSAVKYNHLVEIVLVRSTIIIIYFSIKT
jgi:hypothetical protein